MSFTETVNKAEVITRPLWSIPSLGEESTMGASRKLQRGKLMCYATLIPPLYRVRTSTCSTVENTTNCGYGSTQVQSQCLEG